MPTPRFRNLNPAAAIQVVNAFLGGESSVRFTEKLAGQHFAATINPDGSVSFTKKSGEAKGSIFPTVEKALQNNHPTVSRPTEYSFEIVRKSNRPDFIDYDLSHEITAVEYSGNMTKSVADSLNAAQEDAFFMTRQDIVRPVEGVSLSPDERALLQAFIDTAKSGKPTKQQYLEAEDLLSQIVDRGDTPSSLGGKRIEGLFGTAEGVGFKIPSKVYSEIQALQAKFYAYTKTGGVKKLYDRFYQAAGRPQTDTIVQDLVDYINILKRNPPPTGFRVFFAQDELKYLRHLTNRLLLGDQDAAKKLARLFFARVGDKASWAASWGPDKARTTERINRKNKNELHENILRRFIREIIS